MIKLLNLEVKNFRSLIDTTIEEFGNVNMFYGFNNSGKSNIFKFLKLLFERKRSATTIKYQPDEGNLQKATQTGTLMQDAPFWRGEIRNEPFLFSGNDRSNPITFSVLLELDNDLFEEQDSLKKDGFLSEKPCILLLVGQITSVDIETSDLKIVEAFLNAKRFFRVDDEIDYFFEGSKDPNLNNSLGQSILALLNDIVLLIDSDRNFTRETSKNGVESIDIKNFKNGLYELYINAEKNDSFNKLLGFLSDFEFSEHARGKLGSSFNSFPFKKGTQIGFTKFEDEIEIMLNNENGRFPLKNYGTGIQQFLYILARIYQTSAKIIIIEELELNLSPLYQRELLRFLKLLMPSLFHQLIFSSHSPFFTEKDSVMIDIIHEVRIGLLLNGGTSVDCHDDIPSTVNSETGESYLSLEY